MDKLYGGSRLLQKLGVPAQLGEEVSDADWLAAGRISVRSDSGSVVSNYSDSSIYHAGGHEVLFGRRVEQRGQQSGSVDSNPILPTPVGVQEPKVSSGRNRTPYSKKKNTDDRTQTRGGSKQSKEKDKKPDASVLGYEVEFPALPPVKRTVAVAVSAPPVIATPQATQTHVQSSQPVSQVGKQAAHVVRQNNASKSQGGNGNRNRDHAKNSGNRTEKWRQTTNSSSSSSGDKPGQAQPKAQSVSGALGSSSSAKPGQTQPAVSLKSSVSVAPRQQPKKPEVVQPKAKEKIPEDFVEEMVEEETVVAVVDLAELEAARKAAEAKNQEAEKKLKSKYRGLRDVYLSWIRKLAKQNPEHQFQSNFDAYDVNLDSCSLDDLNKAIDFIEADTVRLRECLDHAAQQVQAMITAREQKLKESRDVYQLLMEERKTLMKEHRDVKAKLDVCEPRKKGKGKQVAEIPQGEDSNFRKDWDLAFLQSIQKLPEQELSVSAEDVIAIWTPSIDAARDGNQRLRQVIEAIAGHIAHLEVIKDIAEAEKAATIAQAEVRKKVQSEVKEVFTAISKGTNDRGVKLGTYGKMTMLRTIINLYKEHPEVVSSVLFNYFDVESFRQTVRDDEAIEVRKTNNPGQSRKDRKKTLKVSDPVDASVPPVYTMNERMHRIIVRDSFRAMLVGQHFIYEVFSSKNTGPKSDEEPKPLTQLKGLFESLIVVAVENNDFKLIQAMYGAVECYFSMQYSEVFIQAVGLHNSLEEASGRFIPEKEKKIAEVQSKINDLREELDFLRVFYVVSDLFPSISIPDQNVTDSLVKTGQHPRQIAFKLAMLCLKIVVQHRMLWMRAFGTLDYWANNGKPLENHRKYIEAVFPSLENFLRAKESLLTTAYGSSNPQQSNFAWFSDDMLVEVQILLDLMMLEGWDISQLDAEHMEHLVDLPVVLHPNVLNQALQLLQKIESWVKSGRVPMRAVAYAKAKILIYVFRHYTLGVSSPDANTKSAVEPQLNAMIEHFLHGDVSAWLEKLSYPVYKMLSLRTVRLWAFLPPPARRTTPFDRKIASYVQQNRSYLLRTIDDVGEHGIEATIPTDFSHLSVAEMRTTIELHLNGGLRRIETDAEGSMTDSDLINAMIRVLNIHIRQGDQ